MEHWRGKTDGEKRRESVEGRGGGGERELRGKERGE